MRQVETHWLTFLTSLSDPAATAAALSGLPVTLAAILTFTLLLAVRPEPTHYTLCVNTPQHTHVETQDRGRKADIVR